MDNFILQLKEKSAQSICLKWPNFSSLELGLELGFEEG